MDVEFLVQDTYSLVRPQWKVAPDLEEAGRLFGEAIAQNYKVQDGDKAAEVEDDDVESISSDANGEEGLDEDGVPDIDDMQSSADEAEPFSHNAEQDGEGVESESEDEKIYVSRQEEERDPEAEADFDRAFEKMMTESMEGRRFERKALFDIPLPMRPSRRETAGGEEPPTETQQLPNTMAFSLMTKKGNRQQVRSRPSYIGGKSCVLTLYRLVRLSCRQIPALQWP
jgi:regulator of nonsense transcripts 2